MNMTRNSILALHYMFISIHKGNPAPPWPESRPSKVMQRALYTGSLFWLTDATQSDCIEDLDNHRKALKEEGSLYTIIIIIHYK